MSKQLNHSRKGLINSENTDDNKCFKWCLVRYLHPVGKDFARRFDFKDIKFPVKIRDICKIEKNNCMSVSLFGYENRQKSPFYVSKKL